MARDAPRTKLTLIFMAASRSADKAKSTDTMARRSDAGRAMSCRSLDSGNRVSYVPAAG